MEDVTRRVAIDRAAYGKDSFRVVVGPAGPDRAILDAAVSIAVEGAFEASYRSGDNSSVLPSDTLRRHALSECAGWQGEPVEALAERIANRLLAANQAFQAVEVTADVGPWVPSGPGSWDRTGRPYRVGSRATGTTAVAWGAVEVELLAAGGSAFTGFLRDPLTVQSEALDRPVAASIGLRWTVAGTAAHTPRAGATASEVVDAASAAFAAGPTGSVQELAYRMAATVLARVPHLAGVDLVLRAAPLIAFPEELAGPAPASLTHEWGAGPVGVTEISLRAEP